MEKKLKTFMLVSAFVIAADHLSKWIVKSTMRLDQTVSVIGDFLTISYIQNQGIAFGLFDSNSSQIKAPLLVIISILALGIILYIFFSMPARVKLSGLAMGLILGGALGNMIDRIAAGKVVDFIDVDFPDISIKAFNVHMTRWPTFNIADASVLIGIIMLLVLIIVEGGRAERAGA